jgi:hypothetical protein
MLVSLLEQAKVEGGEETKTRHASTDMSREATEEPVWHLSSNFTKLGPKDVLKKLYADDEANYQRAKSELVDEIQLLDDAIVLYIQPLQEAYRHVEQWKTKPSMRAAMAMAASALNYILLARHDILLGYLPEVRDLLRGCHERVTRSYLFFLDEDSANKFLFGKEIKQEKVDDKLAQILSKADKRDEELYQSLRQSYSFQSEHMHPNLKSLKLRIGEKDEDRFNEIVGVNHFFGGLLSRTLGKSAVADVLISFLLALKVINAIVKEGTGSWDKEYYRIEGELRRYVQEIKANIPQQVESGDKQ